jgi:hypothetical protein
VLRLRGGGGRWGCFAANKFYKKEVEIGGRERRVESQVIY